MISPMVSPVKKRHFVGVMLAVLVACSGAGAQMRGRISSSRTPSVHMATSYRARSVSASNSTGAFQAPRQTTLIRVLPDGRVVPSLVPTASLASFGSANGVPGLGFDYPHLAAVGGGLSNNSRNRSGRGRNFGQGSYVPILFGGYPYYYDSLDYDQPQQQQPQVAVDQQPVPADTPQQDAYPANESAAASAEPVRDVGEFILVQRDGRVLFASAFSVVGAQLRYVTPEGIRHTVPMSDLDADATQQMNEARGTTIQLRN
jgi:hypothetical protein